jgi:hypothetical protein
MPPETQKKINDCFTQMQLLEASLWDFRKSTEEVASIKAQWLHFRNLAWTLNNEWQTSK